MFLDILDLDEQFKTTEIVTVSLNLKSYDGMPSQAVVKVYRRAATVQQLIDYKRKLLSLKPKRFVYFIIPNPIYSYNLVEYSYYLKKVNKVLNTPGPRDFKSYIFWTPS